MSSDEDFVRALWPENALRAGEPPAPPAPAPSPFKSPLRSRRLSYGDRFISASAGGSFSALDAELAAATPPRRTRPSPGGTSAGSQGQPDSPAEEPAGATYRALLRAELLGGAGAGSCAASPARRGAGAGGPGESSAYGGPVGGTAGAGPGAIGAGSVSFSGAAGLSSATLGVGSLARGGAGSFPGRLPPLPARGVGAGLGPGSRRSSFGGAAGAFGAAGSGTVSGSSSLDGSDAPPPPPPPPPRASPASSARRRPLLRFSPAAAASSPSRVRSPFSFVPAGARGEGAFGNAARDLSSAFDGVARAGGAADGSLGVRAALGGIGLGLGAASRAPSRRIPRAPYKVLDAPGLADDFYLSLIAWSSQGVLAVGLGSRVFLWSASTGAVAALTDLGPSRSVTSVAWSSRGGHLAIGADDGKVEIWDAAATKRVRTLSGHAARVGVSAWGRPLLATGSRDRVALLRDPRLPGDALVSTLAGHRSEVCGLAWAPNDDRKLASGGNDNALLVWDLAATRASGAPAGGRGRGGFGGGDSGLGYDIGSFETRDASGSPLSARGRPGLTAARPAAYAASTRAATVATWPNLGGAARADARIPPSGGVVISGAARRPRAARPLDLPALDVPPDPLLSSPPSRPLSSPSGLTHASPPSASRRGNGHGARPASRSPSLPLPHALPLSPPGSLSQSSGGSSATSPTPTSLPSRVAAARSARSPYASPPASAMPYVPASPGSSRSPSLVPSSSGMSRSTVSVSPPDRGSTFGVPLASPPPVASPVAPSAPQPLLRFSGHKAAVRAVAWSPHQHGLLASGGGTADRTIRFWSASTGQALSCVDTGSQVCNLAWSRTSRELVSTHGYSQNQVVVWKYPSMEKVATLTGHSTRVLYLAASPDGQTIVTGAGDETLRFWTVFPPPAAREGRGPSGYGAGKATIR